MTKLNINLQKGLVGHWTMSQDSLKGSLLADKTPYENDGTIYGATFTTDRMGQANKALSFDGVNDYVKAGNVFNEEKMKYTMTASAWFKSDVVQTEKYILSKKQYSLDNRAFGIYVYNQEVIWSVHDDNNTQYNNVSSFSLGNWVNVVGTWDNGIQRIYINGVLIASSTRAFSRINYSSATFLIGAADRGVNNFFNGDIDDVRIYNRALSEDEIKLLYESYNSRLLLHKS